MWFAAALEAVKSWLGFKASEKQALVEDHKADDDYFAAKATEDDKVDEHVVDDEKDDKLIKDGSWSFITVVIILSGIFPEQMGVFFANIIATVPAPLLYLWMAEPMAALGIRFKRSW